MKRFLADLVHPGRRRACVVPLVAFSVVGGLRGAADVAIAAGIVTLAGRAGTEDALVAFASGAAFGAVTVGVLVAISEAARVSRGREQPLPPELPVERAHVAARPDGGDLLAVVVAIAFSLLYAGEAIEAIGILFGFVIGISLSPALVALVWQRRHRATLYIDPRRKWVWGWPTLYARPRERESPPAPGR